MPIQSGPHQFYIPLNTPSLVDISAIPVFQGQGPTLYAEFISKCWDVFPHSGWRDCYEHLQIQWTLRGTIHTACYDR